MRVRIYIWFLLLLGFTACKKQEYPESVVVGDVQYSFAGDIGGRQVKYEAGREGYYMFTAVNRASSGLHFFEGAFRREDCPGCGEAFEISISDFVTRPLPSAAALDSLLVPRNYPFVTNNYVTEYNIKLQPMFNKQLQQVTWDFGDGTGSSEYSPTHKYLQPGKYMVSMTAKSTNGCQSTIQNQIEINDDPMDCVISAGGDSLVTVFSAAITGGRKPYKYAWDFGDGRTSNATTPVHAYLVPGGYPVTLTVTDSIGKTARTTYNAVARKDGSSCAANFTYGRGTNPYLSLSQAVIRWRDASGRLFTSQGPQKNSYFTVTSAQRAGENERGQQIVKLTARVSCTLYNGPDTVELKNGEMVIAVAYQ